MDGSPPEGVTQLVASYDYNRLADGYEGSETTDASETIDTSTVTVEARHHLGDGWAIDARVPVGTVHLDRGSAASRRRSGFGDLELGGRYDFGALWGMGGYTPSLTLRLALGLPTGESSLAREIGDALPPSVLSIGTGAFSAVGQLVYTHFLQRWVALTVPIAARAPISRNAQGNRIGAQLSTGVGGLFILTDELRTALTVTHAISGRTDNEVNGELVNSGGQRLLGSLNVSLQATTDTSLWVGATVPLYIDVNGTQLAQTFSLNAGVARVFGRADEAEDEDEHGHAHGHGHAHEDEHGHAHGDEHGHGHDDGHRHGGEHGHGHEDGHDDGHGHGDEHGDEHGHEDGHEDGHADAEAHQEGRGDGAVDRAAVGIDGAAAGPPKRKAPAHRPDVADVASGGASFALADAVVAGKVTVIDFWATWCKPCQEIDRDLRAMAKRHPDLAVRRVEITEADCPASQQHLGGEPALPTVWIHGADGKRLDDLRGVPPTRVRSAVEARLH